MFSHGSCAGFKPLMKSFSNAPAECLSDHGIEAVESDGNIGNLCLHVAVEVEVEEVGDLRCIFSLCEAVLQEQGTPTLRGYAKAKRPLCVYGVVGEVRQC